MKKRCTLRWRMGLCFNHLIWKKKPREEIDVNGFSNSTMFAWITVIEQETLIPIPPPQKALPAIYCGQEFMSGVGSKNTGAPLYYKSLGGMMIKMDTTYLLSEKNLTLCCNAFSPQL
ncbi:hypothetical protein MKW92_022935, partial [Papaver armeniacum]